MRHYEIVFLIHPDTSEPVASLIERYKKKLTEGKGKIHREENWGLRKLAYPVKKATRAYYVLMNIEVNQETLQALKHTLTYEEAILRHLIINCDRPITEPSPVLKNKDRQHRSTWGQAASQPSQGMIDDKVETENEAFQTTKMTQENDHPTGEEKNLS